MAAIVLLAADSSQGRNVPLAPGLVVPACADRVSPDKESAETRAEAEGIRNLRLRLLKLPPLLLVRLLLTWLEKLPSGSVGKRGEIPA